MTDSLRLKRDVPMIGTKGAVLSDPSVVGYLRKHWPQRVDSAGEEVWTEVWTDGPGPSHAAPQPPPGKGSAISTSALVAADMFERHAAGLNKYGVAHQHDNGRDHLIDAYQEALDLCIYLRAEIERRKVSK